MNQGPLISVVMPVYGVEQYLEDCINSILSQIYNHFEIILVDDCSVDRSGKICDEFSEKYDNIKVIHLETNGGLSNARNCGFANVSGEYVLFIDSDDTVETNLFSSLVNAIKENDADVTVFSICEEYYTKSGILSHCKNVAFDQNYFFRTKDELRPHVIQLEEKTLYGYAWNKMYRCEYLRKVHAKFENVKLIEDILFNVFVFNEISSLNLLSDVLYHYKKRVNLSLTNNFVAEYYAVSCQRVAALLEQYKKWELLDDHVKTVMASIYFRYTFSALQRNCDKKSQMNMADRKLWIKNNILKNELWAELSPFVPIGFSLSGLMNAMLKTGNMTLFLIIGRITYIIKNTFPKIFSLIKDN